MALYADLNRKIRVLIKEGAENAEALFPAGYDFMKEEGDADLIVCASAPPEEANAPVVFWNAPRGRNDGFCLPKEENKGREKLRAYLSAAVMTKNRREDFARHAAFVCAADDASQEALLKIKRRFGKNAVMKGTSYREGATGLQRNGQIGGHKA